MKKKMVFLMLSLFLSGCGSQYRVQTQDGWKTVPLDEALAQADTMDELEKLREQSFWPEEEEIICQKQRECYVKMHPELNDQLKQIILRGSYCTGMTKEQFLLSRYASKRGRRPADINRTVGSWGVHEQWVFGSIEYDNMRFFYFDNGVLTSWQD